MEENTYECGFCHAKVEYLQPHECKEMREDAWKKRQQMRNDVLNGIREDLEAARKIVEEAMGKPEGVASTYANEMMAVIVFQEIRNKATRDTPAFATPIVAMPHVPRIATFMTPNKARRWFNFKPR